MAPPSDNRHQSIHNAHLMWHGREFFGSYQELVLNSAFQPIFSLAHKRMVGVEALVRGRNADGKAVMPDQLFQLPGTLDDQLHLDRIIRSMHVGNFSVMQRHPAWLFLNLNPNLIIHGARNGVLFTEELLQNFGVSSHQIVVELLEKRIADEQALEEVIAHYRAMNCLIAIDDFGAGRSNFDRIWRFRPDIIKFDRSLIVHAACNPLARRILPSLVKLAHEVGCLALIEGIETEEEALIAMDCDADFVQGYLFARPVAWVALPQHAAAPLVSQLSSQWRSVMEQDQQAWQHTVEPYKAAFAVALQAIRQDTTIEIASRSLLAAHPQIRRCFLLNNDGVQISHNIGRHRSLASSQHDMDQDRFSPLNDAEQADWSRRPYFRQAMQHPEQIQVVGPYLSIPDLSLCLTLSASILHHGERMVYCCDLDFSG
ncbi:MAG: EAL domain-containing protein [Magnetococcales bacterium]|nr:EAL domain-containing protein [Magnetococcales bacterium]